jgi:pyruvate dehydrogenase E1 component alpha subunit
LSSEAHTSGDATAAGGDHSAAEIAELLGLYRRMVEIRCFEDAVERLFTRNLIRGSTHLGQGQEAVAVGACSALRPDDVMTCTYRGHDAVLAMGASPTAAMAELLGRRDGLCGGKGGSMHLTDVKNGAYGSFAIVGGHLPFAVGAALAGLRRDEPLVSLTFFGDGATNIGAFHEALNLAAIWRLPVIFVCENNLYGEYSPIAATTPVTRLTERAKSYAMRSVQVDGNDVLAVRDLIAEAAAEARVGGGPLLVEALTYRHKGHSRTDPATYRPPEEVEAWLERDPIVRFGGWLIERGHIDGDGLAEIRDAAAATVQEATEAALALPEPDPETRFEDIFA